MASTMIEADMGRWMKENITITIRVKPPLLWKRRFRLGAWFVRLGAWIMGVGHEELCT